MGSYHRPPASRPRAHTRPPARGLTSSNSALIAGIATVFAVGGGIAFFLWLHQPVDPIAEGEETPTEVVLVRPPEVVVTPTEPDPVVPLIEQTNEAPVIEISEPTGTAPMATVKNLVRSVLLREPDGITSVLGGQLSAIEMAGLLSNLQNAVVSIDRDHPVTDLGREGVVERWSVNLVNLSTGAEHPLILQFEPDVEGAWHISKVELPPSLEITAAASGPVITQAENFIEKLTVRKFGELEPMVMGASVPREKLAALGIIFDEAEFQPDESRPLKATNVSADRAWFIAKVHSEKYGLDSEFGLELRREGEEWLIERINLSRLMREFTKMATGEGAYNPPLVKTPTGGESIVLYFSYDDHQLTARSLKQLTVVAAMLKTSDEKRIQIGGHADALGEDGYNDALSQLRARRVAEALQSMGVQASQIQLEAFGERHPLSPNLNPDGSDNPSGRERNRRAEIYLDF